MIRTKQSHHRREGLPDATKRIYTFQNILKIIDCEELEEFYDSCCGYDTYVKGDNLYEGVEIFQKWLDETDDNHIFKKLRDLKKWYLSAFFDAQRMVDPEYEHHFKRVLKFKGIPSKMAQPLVLFYPASRNEGSFVKLDQPKQKPIKGGRIIIRGTVPFASDFKTIFALMEIMDRKEIDIFRDEILYFQTSATEIAKEMGASNPWAKLQHHTIFNSLKRLRECTIVWDWKDHTGRNHWKIGGILVKAHTEPSSGELDIYFDMDFIRLFE